MKQNIKYTLVGVFMEEIKKKSNRGGRRPGAGRPRKYSTNRRHTVFCSDIQYFQIKALLGKLRLLSSVHQDLFDAKIDGNVFLAKKAEIEKVTVGEIIADGKNYWSEYMKKTYGKDE